MIKRKVRMMIMPITMTAIIAPELWMRICSLDFVVIVVFEGDVVALVTGEAVEACIFSSNLTVSSLIWLKPSPGGSLSSTSPPPSAD